MNILNQVEQRPEHKPQPTQPNQEQSRSVLLKDWVGEIPKRREENLASTRITGEDLNTLVD